MKSDTPDEFFVFPDSPSLGPNCVLLSSEADSSSIGLPNRPDSDSLTPNLLLLSSEADSVFFTDIIPPLSFFSEFDFSVDDLPF